jgi:hypothetical protein
MTATADMHKQKVAATVAVTNNDKTTQTYVCDGVTVLDPESVDMVLMIVEGDVNNDYPESVRVTMPDSLFIPGQTPLTVQIPNNVTNCNITCVPRVGADDTALRTSGGITWDEEPVSNLGYFSPAGCAPGKKYSVEATVPALCLMVKQN